MIILALFDLFKTKVIAGIYHVPLYVKKITL